MIQLLFALIFMEMILIMAFVFKTPFRKLVIMGLDRTKRGRGPIVVKTVSGTVFGIMVTILYNVVVIQKRWIQDGGEVNPTDQILFSKRLLEASLMDFQFLIQSQELWNTVVMLRIFAIPRTNDGQITSYIRELRIRRKTTEAVKKQNRVIENRKLPISEETKKLEEEITNLREKVKVLETHLSEKSKDAGSAEANAEALKKQSERFLTEYERLLDENQDLRSQLESLDRRFSDGKKSM